MANTKALERVRYFPRQLMTADDMRTEQDYFLERMRRHNRLFHGWGILCGLEVVTAATAAKPWQVRVGPGDACAASGDEIHVPAAVCFDLARPPVSEAEDCTPCPCPPSGSGSIASAGNATWHLAIRWVQRALRPVRTGHGGCACDCDENHCETSRYRDEFELALLPSLGGPYASPADKNDEQWLANLKLLVQGSDLFNLPTRPNPPPTSYPWVVLATVTADLSKAPPAHGNDLNYNLGLVLEGSGILRRPLLRNEDLLRLWVR